MARIGRAFVLVLAALTADRAVAGEPPPPPPVIAGADAKARIAAAQEMKKKDVPGLLRALSALGASKTKDVDREFLLAYALQERDRAPRVIAVEALSHLDRKGAVDWFKAHADGKDETATLVSLECLGYLGAKEQVATAIDLIKNSNELIAVAAADVAARLGEAKDLETIAENGLAHVSEHVTDHAAWAVQDILKKSKEAAKYFEKWAGKKSDPKAIRAQATVALLQDKSAEPHAWSDSLAAAKDLATKAPASIEIKSASDDYKKNVEAGLDWLKTNMPAAEFLVRAAAKRIDVPGAKHPDDWIETTEQVIQVPLTRASWAPKQMAFHLLWMGTVLWQERTGEPYKGHRGWEPALPEVYDLCVIAKLYDAGPGGVTRANWIKDQIEKHQWGSQ